MANDTSNAVSSGDLHPGFTTQGAVTPQPDRQAQPQPTDRRQLDNPRAQARGPAHDARVQQQDAVIESKVKFGDGTEYAESQVRDALAHQAEQAVRKQALPQSPNGYQIALPPDFKAPEGVKFEFDMRDPALAQFRALAHARGMDQQTFSDALGVYAATKIAENQTVHTARAAELGKLGSAADARINAIEIWLKSRIGAKAGLFVSQMRNYPVAAMVEGFEDIMRGVSNQGGVDFSQSGRQEQERQSQVPAFDGTNFAQVRAAQDALPRSGDRVR